MESRNQQVLGLILRTPSFQPLPPSPNPSSWDQGGGAGPAAPGLPPPWPHAWVPASALSGDAAGVAGLALISVPVRIPAGPLTGKAVGRWG